MFKIWLILVFSFAAYTAAVYKYCDTRKNELPSGAVTVGWRIWQAKNCQSCHQLYGLGGYLGPDLTNIASDPAKTEQYIDVFVKYGTSKMPNFHLDDSEVHQVVAFLKWVDKSGKSKVPAEKVDRTGNYKIDN